MLTRKELNNRINGLVEDIKNLKLEFFKFKLSLEKDPAEIVYILKNIKNLSREYALVDSIVNNTVRYTLYSHRGEEYSITIPTKGGKNGR